MSAIFGFTFHMGRMTEVLTPDIYIELTGKILAATGHVPLGEREMHKITCFHLKTSQQGAEYDV